MYIFIFDSEGNLKIISSKLNVSFSLLRIIFRLFMSGVATTMETTTRQWWVIYAFHNWIFPFAENQLLLNHYGLVIAMDNQRIKREWRKV